MEKKSPPKRRNRLYAMLQIEKNISAAKTKLLSDKLKSKPD